MITLSFIIPVYNVESYLHKCVDSILMQDYHDYEIILVDDGSTDNSQQICDAYSSEYSKIRTIHKSNGGLSDARNAGLKVAAGEYIVFLDSDDYWEPNVLAALMAQVEREQLDVLRFDYQNVRISANGELKTYRPNKSPHLPVCAHEVVDCKTYLDKYMDYECLAVQFIMKRKLVCEFEQGIHYEDLEWMPRMMQHAKRVNGTSLMVYNYLIRPGSITQAQGQLAKMAKNVEGKMTAMRTYAQMMSKYPDVSWYHEVYSSIVNDILDMVVEALYNERKKYIEQLTAVNAFPLCYFKTDKRGTRRIYLINHMGPNAYCTMMHTRRKIMGSTFLQFVKKLIKKV